MPAAGYELDRIAAEGISRSNPLKAARAGAQGGRRARHRPRRSSSAARPTRCSAAAATSPGPVGLVAALRRIPLVLTEADSHLGLTNRALAPRARRVCLAFPLEGREGERYRVTGRPVPPTVDRPRRRPRRSSASARTRRACSCSAARSAPARSTPRPSKAFADAPYRVLHVAGKRDFAELRAARARTTSCATT